MGSELVDEKALGTGHIALGHPVKAKEVVGIPHCDLVFRQPTLVLDGDLLIEGGDIGI